MASPLLQNTLILASAGQNVSPIESCKRFSCLRRENVLDAIALAATTPFDWIFLTVGQITGRMDQAVESIRKIAPQAKIVLLCSMVEEPMAIRLTRAGLWDTPQADDYVIFPEQLPRWLKKAVLPADEIGDQQQDASDAIRLLEKMATEDDLTGLKNRRYIRQFLRQLIDYAQQDEFHITLLLFDIDNFKHYNDTFGHTLGDQVLSQVGQMMKMCCRAHDVVARVGGDEFAVIFWDIPKKDKSQPETAQEKDRRLSHGGHPREPLFMAERFRRLISSAQLSSLGNHGKGSLTISGGLIAFPDDGQTEQELFAKADQALLLAKQNGKNRINIVGDTQNASSPPPSQI